MNQPAKKPDLKAARGRRSATKIGDWVLHPDLGVLRKDSDEVRLNAKTLHVLLVLLDAGDKGVSREALLDQVWGESYPTDTVISRAMADLRAAFGMHCVDHSSDSPALLFLLRLFVRLKQSHRFLVGHYYIYH